MYSIELVSVSESSLRIPKSITSLHWENDWDVREYVEEQSWFWPKCDKTKQKYRSFAASMFQQQLRLCFSMMSEELNFPKSCKLAKLDAVLSKKVEWFILVH